MDDILQVSAVSRSTDAMAHWNTHLDRLTTAFYAQTLNNAMLENNCSEQASRMSAMESSTKNAKEMLEKLTLSYNRHAPPFHVMRLAGSLLHDACCCGGSR